MKKQRRVDGDSLGKRKDNREWSKALIVVLDRHDVVAL